MTFTAKFKFEGPKTLIAKMPKDLPIATKNALNEISQGFLAQLREYAPKQTGNYAKSWRIDVADEKRVRLASPKGALFNWLEFTGTKPHDIVPVKKKVLKFHVVGGAGGQQGPFFVFTKHVSHPGFDNIPHARPALKEITHQAPAIILKHLGKQNRMIDNQKFATTKINIRRTVTRKTGRKVLRRKRASRVKVDR